VLIAFLISLLLYFVLLHLFSTEENQSHLPFFGYQVEMPIARFAILQSLRAIQQ